MKFLKRLFCKIFGHQYCFGDCLRCGASEPVDVVERIQRIQEKYALAERDWLTAKKEEDED